MALLVADLGYLYQSLYGSYAERDPADFGWWMGYALIVAVLLHPRCRGDHRRRRFASRRACRRAGSSCCRW